MRVSQSNNSFRRAVPYGILALSLVSVVSAGQSGSPLAVTFEDRTLTVTDGGPGQNVIAVGLVEAPVRACPEETPR